MACSNAGRRRERYWCPPQEPLAPLMEGPTCSDMEEELQGKRESSWEAIREWFRIQKSVPAGGNEGRFSMTIYGNVPAKRQDLRLLLGVLGCPLAPIPLPADTSSPCHLQIKKDHPIETSSAHYIIQQYLAATGCSNSKQHNKCSNKKNMYTVGVVKMICCETEISSGKGVKTLGTRRGENGCFVLWQMSPGMWSLELAVGGSKVLAGSDGRLVWRHTPWLGTHAAKGPHRPLRRIIQGLDPRSTASLFAKAQCLGEKRIGEEDCFVLKVAADRSAVMERSDGPAEVIRHVLYGYFSQKSGLLIYIEDSHLTRVQSPQNDGSFAYWETTIGSSIGDYRDVDGVLISHQGRTIATVFRFGETSAQHTRTRMEEEWRIHDVVFNVPGLSVDSFIVPADVY